MRPRIGLARNETHMKIGRTKRQMTAVDNPETIGTIDWGFRRRKLRRGGFRSDTISWILSVTDSTMPPLPPLPAAPWP
jgi:hypothetical protein